ncbi:MAG: efflux RND transporter periplasmic adaptor subunit [Thermoguttaceae bacterium]|jgi:RND family efflux transporter MFP subunit
MRNLKVWQVALAAIVAATVAQAQTSDSEVQDQGIEGFTEPIRKLDLIPPEPGIIASLSVHEGDRVKKDQLLGSLDCDTQQVALEIAKANMAAHGKLDSATAERDLRRWRLAKLQKLRAEGHANEEEVNRAADELAVAEANVLTALEQHATDSLEVDRIASMIERRMMRSPFDGVVTRVFREEKEFVGSNNTPVLTIMQLDKLRVIFTIPTALAVRLKADHKVLLTFPNSNQRAVGKIESISPVTEAESDTVRVKVLIDNAEGKYRCGVRCAINLNKLP